MHCNNRKFISMIVLLLTVALCLQQLVLGAEADDGLNRAMQAFVNAVKNKNIAGVLAAFSRTTPWQHVTYDAANQRKPPSRSPVTYTQMQKDFRIKKGLYGDFFNEYDGSQMLSDNIKYMGKRMVKKGTTYTPNDATLGRFYIKWRHDGKRWVISEIGETVS
jgi:hypothetical protein